MLILDVLTRKGKSSQSEQGMRFECNGIQIRNSSIVELTNDSFLAILPMPIAIYINSPFVSKTGLWSRSEYFEHRNQGIVEQYIEGGEFVFILSFTT